MSTYLVYQNSSCQLARVPIIHIRTTRPRHLGRVQSHTSTISRSYATLYSFCQRPCLLVEVRFPRWSIALAHSLRGSTGRGSKEQIDHIDWERRKHRPAHDPTYLRVPSIRHRRLDHKRLDLNHNGAILGARRTSSRTPLHNNAILVNNIQSSSGETYLTLQ